MIAFLASAILAAVIGMFISLHALPLIKKIVMGWVWLYSSIAPEEDREGRRLEVLSHIHEMTNTLLKSGHTPGEIAVRMLEILVLGLVDDVSWSMQFMRGALADKIVGWSDSLRQSRVPAAMIAGVATLAPMNYGFFISPANQPLYLKIIMNAIIIGIITLLWKTKQPRARCIFNLLMSITVIAGIVAMMWLTINYHLYEMVSFKIFMLAMVSALPITVAINKSRRKFLTGKTLCLFVTGWVFIISGALIGSWTLAGSVKPLFDAWLQIALSVVAMFIFYGSLILASSGLCWAGMRGSAGGLRLVAAGLRRLS
jgi:hypothetical protein